MRVVSMAVAAGAALLVAAPAAADEWSDQVRRLMDAAAEKFAENGYHYGGYTHEGSLNDDGKDTMTVRLGSGMNSMLIAACDTDCSDVDLILYDANGNTVDSDFELDDFPIVSTTPGRDGVYRLEVQMVACSANPCRYAIQQFVK